MVRCGTGAALDRLVGLGSRIRRGGCFPTGLWICSLVVVLGLGSGALSAREFRSIRPIAVPQVGSGGTTASPVAQPVSRTTAVKALRQVLAAWNTPRLREKLAPGFYDADRLGDVVDSVVPRDASIRVLGVRDVQTYGQKVIADPERGGRRYRISTVSVVAETQVEFNSPSRGFRRLRGVNEYLLEVREPL